MESSLYKNMIGFHVRMFSLSVWNLGLSNLSKLGIMWNWGIGHMGLIMLNGEMLLREDKGV